MTEMHLLLDFVETPIGRLAVVADDHGRLRAAGWTEGHSRMEKILRPHARAERESGRETWPRPHARAERESGRETWATAQAFLATSNPGGLSQAFRAYFAGELTALDAVPVAIEVGSVFQRAVWQALRRIPSGETRSYAELARSIGHPTAVRAVGLAAGANPIAVALPCHRVIGSNGSLTGYGGGLDRKRWLLAHERSADFSLQLSLQ